MPQLNRGEFFKRDRLKNYPIVFVDRYLPDIKSNYVVAVTSQKYALSNKRI